LRRIPSGDHSHLSIAPCGDNLQDSARRRLPQLQESFFTVLAGGLQFHIERIPKQNLFRFPWGYIVESNMPPITIVPIEIKLPTVHALSAKTSFRRIKVFFCIYNV
jgi:hypothetical protein